MESVPVFMSSLDHAVRRLKTVLMRYQTDHHTTAIPPLRVLWDLGYLGDPFPWVETAYRRGVVGRSPSHQHVCLSSLSTAHVPAPVPDPRPNVRRG